MGKLSRRVALLLILTAGCAQRRVEPAATFAPPVSTALQALGPTTLETSAPISPEWVMRSTSQDSGALSFVGQSNAPTLDAAKGRAERDLLAAISSYVSVDVESDMEDVSWSNNGSEGQSIRSTTKTKTSAALSQIRPDGYYWERVASSPLAIDSADYRYYLHASVSKAELTRVRLTKLASRKSSSGKQIVALLPFRTAGGSTTAVDLIARGLFEETGRLLARSDRLHLAEESVVRSAIGDASNDQDRAERVRNALLPDWLVRAAITSHGTRLRISAVVEDGSERGQTITLIRPASALSSLATELSRAIAQKIGTRAEMTKRAPAAQKTDDDFFRAYHEAGIKFQSGALDEALASIKRAIELSPNHAPAHLRLGRILERFGRFAKIPPAQPHPYAEEYLYHCTPETQYAEQKAQQFLYARQQAFAAGKSGAGAQPWWDEQTPLVDQVLDAALASMEDKEPGKPYVSSGVQIFSFDDPPEWIEPRLQDTDLEVEEPASPKSAVEAYARAEQLASLQKDERGSMEAALALADLSARVDRFDYALWLYRRVQNYAQRTKDPHFESLAHYGRAIIYRKKSWLIPARAELYLALEARAKLGEKPYILEIYNELGSVASTLSEYDAAEAFYRLALRIADELSSDYLRSVLANNLGAVEYARGRTTEAAERFQRAADRLTDLRESEGRITSTMNLAAALGLRAELDPAGLLYAEVDRLISATQQEGRIAELALHRGASDLHRGKYTEGLDGLAISFRLYQRIGRKTDSYRARDAIYASEYYSKGQDRRTLLACMKRRYWSLDAPVFEPEALLDSDHPPPSPLLTATVPSRELVFALDAAAVLALDPTPTEYDRAVAFAQPAQTPPAEVDPRAEARRLRELEEQRKLQEEMYRRRPTQQLERLELDDDSVRPAQPAPPPTDVEITSSDSGSDAVTAVAEVLAGSASGSSSSEPARQTIQVAKSVDYERILGAFSVDAEVIILLDRETVEAFAVPRLIPSARRALQAVAASFDKRGARRHAAAAQLNNGALAWAGGDGEAAYEAFMSAERAFAASGDARGLAHVHAWLAHLFETSGAPDIAAEHRWVSEQLFTRVLAR